MKLYGEARIIPISSLALVLAPRGGIAFKDLKTTQAYWILGKWQRYAQSKLANLLYGKELSRRYPEILTLIADPGPSNTGLVTSLGSVRLRRLCLLSDVQTSTYNRINDY